MTDDLQQGVLRNLEARTLLKNNAVFDPLLPHLDTSFHSLFCSFSDSNKGVKALIFSANSERETRPYLETKYFYCTSLRL